MATSSEEPRTSGRKRASTLQALYNSVENSSQKLLELMKDPVLSGSDKTVKFAILLKKIYLEFKSSSRSLQRILNSSCDL